MPSQIFPLNKIRLNIRDYSEQWSIACPPFFIGDKPCFMLEDVSMEKPAPTHPISDSQRHSSSRLLGIVVIMFYNLRIH